MSVSVVDDSVAGNHAVFVGDSGCYLRFVHHKSYCQHVRIFGPHLLENFFIAPYILVRLVGEKNIAVILVPSLQTAVFKDRRTHISRKSVVRICIVVQARIFFHSAVNSRKGLLHQAHGRAAGKVGNLKLHRNLLGNLNHLSNGFNTGETILPVMGGCQKMRIITDRQGIQDLLRSDTRVILDTKGYAVGSLLKFSLQKFLNGFSLFTCSSLVPVDTQLVPHLIVACQHDIVDGTSSQPLQYLLKIGQVLFLYAAVAAYSRSNAHLQHHLRDYIMLSLVLEVLFMHVDIDEARRNHAPGNVYGLPRLRHLISDIGNFSVTYAHIGFFHFTRFKIRILSVY